MSGLMDGWVDLFEKHSEVGKEEITYCPQSDFQAEVYL